MYDILLLQQLSFLVRGVPGAFVLEGTVALRPTCQFESEPAECFNATFPRGTVDTERRVPIEASFPPHASPQNIRLCPDVLSGRALTNDTFVEPVHQPVITWWLRERYTAAVNQSGPFIPAAVTENVSPFQRRRSLTLSR